MTVQYPTFHSGVVRFHLIHWKHRPSPRLLISLSHSPRPTTNNYLMTSQELTKAVLFQPCWLWQYKRTPSIIFNVGVLHTNERNVPRPRARNVIVWQCHVYGLSVFEVKSSVCKSCNTSLTHIAFKIRVGVFSSRATVLVTTWSEWSF